MSNLTFRRTCCQKTGRFTATFLLVALLASAGPAFAQCDTIPDCTLVWSDEFDGNALDLSKWSYQRGDGSEVGLPSGWGNNELQYYRPENVNVAGGLLTITAREESFEGRDYTSARIRSLGRGDWSFGRMEMRAKMPIGRGMWPAFWMLPTDSTYGGWAASGEIDIVENIGTRPELILGTIHYGGPFPFNVFSSSRYTLDEGTFHDDFHVFAIEWDYGEIRWYVDGEQYARRVSWYSWNGRFPAPFDVDFHFLLNLAVGGNLPGPPDDTTVFPQEYVIDYVRVYQSPSIVSISSPADNEVIRRGDDLTITVDAGDESEIRTVEFLHDRAVIGEDPVPPYEVTVPGVEAGCYTLRARATLWNGRRDTSVPVQVYVSPLEAQARKLPRRRDASLPSGLRFREGCPQAPFLLRRAPIPGTIEAENYDLGGQGVAYNDANINNNGTTYRPIEGVDLERTADAGGGINIGWIEPGEWTEYAVDVTAGVYDIEVRVASALEGGTLHVEFDGVDKTGPITFGGTGGWQNWKTVRAENVRLDAGLRTMRLSFDAGGFNVNKVDVIESQNGEGTPPGPDSSPVAPHLGLRSRLP